MEFRKKQLRVSYISIIWKNNLKMELDRRGETYWNRLGTDIYS